MGAFGFDSNKSEETRVGTCLSVPLNKTINNKCKHTC